MDDVTSRRGRGVGGGVAVGGAGVGVVVGTGTGVGVLVGWDVWVTPEGDTGVAASGGEESVGASTTPLLPGDVGGADKFARADSA